MSVSLVMSRLVNAGDIFNPSLVRDNQIMITIKDHFTDDFGGHIESRGKRRAGSY